MSTLNSFSPIQLENVGFDNTGSYPTNIIPPLHEAIKNKNTDLIISLLSKETINQKDNNGITPLMVACITDSENIVSLLCNFCSNIDERCTMKGYTAFMYSCFGRNINILKLLISKKCDTSTIDKNSEDICSLGLWPPILKIIEENTIQLQSMVKCRLCNQSYLEKSEWNPDGFICIACSECDLFEKPTVIISDEELKKTGLKRSGRSTPLTPSPVNVLEKSFTYYNCPGCKNKVEISLRICSCGRKSPFSRK